MGIDLHPLDRERLAELLLKRLGDTLAQVDGVAGRLAGIDVGERTGVGAIRDLHRGGFLDGLEAAFERLGTGVAAGQDDAAERHDHRTHGFSSNRLRLVAAWSCQGTPRKSSPE